MGRELSAETIVVGAGIAGLSCALALKRRGQDVHVIARDGGASSLSSGGWDFGPLPLGGQETFEEATGSERWKLLYARIGSAPPSAAIVDELVSEVGGLTFSPRRALCLPTSSGSWKRVFVAQDVQAPGDLSFLKGKRVGLVSGKNWRFDTTQIARSLEDGARKLGSTLELTPCRIEFPSDGFDWPLPHLSTRLSVDPAFRNRFRDAISRELRAQWRDALLFPPLFLSGEHLVQLGKELAVPTAECLATVEPTAGERLTRAIRAALETRAIPLHEVGALAPKTGERTVYALESGGTLHVAKRFVLASGKLLGGGVTLGSHEMRESLFGLPLFSVRARGAVRYRAELPWMERAFADEQPWATLGVRVDDRFRPLDDSGVPILTNLAACGSLLTGVDLARNGLGLGFAAVSGRECGSRME